MNIQTLSGTQLAAANANGLNGTTSGAPLLASQYNADQADLQQQLVQQVLCGVLAGGVCTESALNVTVPSGTVWYARQCWELTGDYVLGIANNATSWIWGCSNGTINVTLGSSISYPVGFDGTSCCLLTEATAVSGVITLFNNMQHQARQVDHDARVVVDGPLMIDHTNKIIDTSAASGGLAIPEATGSDPTVPGTGTYLWMRTDLQTLKASISGLVGPVVPNGAAMTPIADGSSGSAKTIDWSAGTNHAVTLTANCTLSFTAPAPGSILALQIAQDATGSRTVTWPSSVKWGTLGWVVPPGANTRNLATFFYDGTFYISVSITPTY